MQAVLLGQLAHKLLVGIGLLAAQAEVAMGHGHLRAKPVQDVEQHHRVEPAAHGDQDGVGFEGKELVLFDELADAGEHGWGAGLSFHAVLRSVKIAVFRSAVQRTAHWKLGQLQFPQLGRYADHALRY